MERFFVVRNDCYTITVILVCIVENADANQKGLHVIQKISVAYIMQNVAKKRSSENEFVLSSAYFEINKNVSYFHI